MILYRNNQKNWKANVQNETIRGGGKVTNNSHILSYFICFVKWLLIVTIIGKQVLTKRRA